MSDFHRPTHVPKREATADGAALLPTLIRLWPYTWPADRADLKLRVVFATVLLFLAKFATIAVPYTFKWATDALTGHGTAPAIGSPGLSPPLSS
jgi:ATP-binding cassette subfamily B protein